MECVGCNFNNRDDVKYCIHCGTPLFLFCLKCGFPSAEGDIFCGGCGARLSATGAAGIILPAVQATGKSAQVPTSVPSSQHVPSMDAERRNVSVLFADISGFTAMSELLDPEEVTNIMNDCMKLLAGCVVKYEGYVDKFIGDCIMAIFGAPITHENDPELALHSAIAMKKEIEEYNKKIPVKLEKPLTLHIGINSGIVIAGGVGSDQKMDYTVMGDTVNLASRLESNAGTGQIFVSEYTYNPTRNLFEFIRHDPIKVKGKKNPVAVYELVKAKSYQAQADKGGAAIVPLVGRAQEVEIIDACLNKLIEGEGQAVFLISEAGVGKSRIQREVKNHSLKDKYQILDGACRSFNSGTSYFIFSELLKHMFDIDSEDLPDAITEKIGQNIPLLLGLDPKALNQEAREAIVFIGAIMGLKLEDEYDVPVKQMDAQEIKMATFRAISWFFEQLARKKPLILILEDLHYGDSTSIELLTYLFENLKKMPVMLLLLMRHQKEHPSAKLPLIAKKVLNGHCTKVVFNRFTETECDEMVKRILTADNLPVPLLDLVRERADGNPLYIEEIVQSLIDEKIVDKTKEGTVRVVKDLSRVTIPNSIQGMIISRIDKLQVKLKDVLQTASVIGSIFGLELLKKVIKQNDVEEKLNQLVDIGLIFESKTFPEIEYSFRNIMTRDAVYSCLLLQKRKELHAVVANEIETNHENRLEDHFEVLSRHYQQANNLSKAYDYLVKSGLKAKDAYANQDAVDYFNQAIKLADKLDSPSVPLEDVYTALSEVVELLGDLDIAIEVRRKAIELFKDDLNKADAMRNIGRIHEKQGAKEKAMEVYGQTHKLLKNHPESLEMGVLKMNESWVLNRMKKFDKAIEKGMQSLKILESHKSPDNIAQLYNNLAVIFEHKGDMDNALEYNQKSLKLFSKLGNKRKVANVYTSLGYLENKKNELKTALDYFGKSFEIMDKIGNRYGAGTALMSKGRCYIDLEMFDESENALLQALRIHKELNVKKKIIANELALGKVYIEKGDNKAAREHLEISRQIAQKNNYLSDLARSAHMEARLLIKEGKTPDEKYQEAIDLFKGLSREQSVVSVQKEFKEYQKAEK